MDIWRSTAKPSTPEMAWLTSPVLPFYSEHFLGFPYGAPDLLLELILLLSPVLLHKKHPLGSAKQYYSNNFPFSKKTAQITSITRLA